MLKAMARSQRTVVVPRLDERIIDACRRKLPTVPLSPWSEKELEFMRFAPRFYKALNTQVEDGNLPVSQDQLYRQWGQDVISQFAVIEDIVKGGRVSAGALNSKGRWLARLATGFCALDKNYSAIVPSNYQVTEAGIGDRVALPEALGGPFPVDVPMTRLSYPGPAWISGVRNPTDFLYQLKQAYAKMISLGTVVPKWGSLLRCEAKKRDLGFTDELKARFGDDISVLLFGSATDESAVPNDYDTLVLVPRILPEHFAAIDDNPIVFEGKNVDTVLVNKGDWEKFITLSPVSYELARDAVTLAGDISFPPIRLRDAIATTAARAASRILMLNGVANWAAESPDELVGKDGLLRSQAKTVGYVFKAVNALAEVNGCQGRPLKYSNGVLEAQLKAQGVPTRKFGDDPAQILPTLTGIQADVARLIEQIYRPHDRVVSGYVLSRLSGDLTPASRREFEREAEAERALYKENGLARLEARFSNGKE